MDILAIALSTTVILLLWLIAWQDWTQRRISNVTVLLLIGLALFQWSVAPVNPQTLTLNLVLVLLFALPATGKAVLGAGDIKLLFALALLWPTETLIQAFGFGIVGLVVLCAMADKLLPAITTAAPATAKLRTKPFMRQLTERGLPLGTALALGSLTTLI